MNVIVSYSGIDRAIGKNQALPWGDRFSFDRQRFAVITSGRIIVMGRKTWDSLPIKPLPDRLNVVITRTPLVSDKVIVCKNLNEVLALFKFQLNNVYLIGGKKLYQEAFEKRMVKKVYRTVIYEYFSDCDTFYPEVNYEVSKVFQFEKIIDGTKVEFTEEDIKPLDENQYLDLVKSILERGMSSDDRTGTGTFRLFGQSMRFSLNSGTLPLLTTKYVPWKVVLDELLWFISGSTDNKDLHKNGVKIWDANAADYKKLRPNAPEGELGPIYGFQWRHFGARYKGCELQHVDGIDQLERLVYDLVRNPASRRHIISAWNPTQIDQMALPPCHVMAQFLVDEKRLTCILYQRSGDMGLGIPFNIASYALLTHIIAHSCGLDAHELIHHIGDAHVYKNHVKALEEQLMNPLNEFPKLVINSVPKKFDLYERSDFNVVDYNYTPLKTKMEMSV
jgi:dihydrofolate reductase/thymidylate synthase